MSLQLLNLKVASSNILLDKVGLLSAEIAALEALMWTWGIQVLFREDTWKFATSLATFTCLVTAKMVSSLTVFSLDVELPHWNCLPRKSTFSKTLNLILNVEVFCLNMVFNVVFVFRCVLRFPSTNVKIRFTSLLSSNDTTPRRVPSPPKTKALAPLKINIPDHDATFSSPVPSPTGTIRYVVLYHLLLRNAIWFWKVIEAWIETTKWLLSLLNLDEMWWSVDLG